MKITVDIELKELLELGNIVNYRNTMSCKTSINPKLDTIKNAAKEIEKVIVNNLENSLKGIESHNSNK